MRRDEHGYIWIVSRHRCNSWPCKQSRLRNGEDSLKEDSQQYSKQKWQKTNSTHLKLNFALGRLYCRVINAHWFEHISVQRFYTKAMFTHCITWWQHNRDFRGRRKIAPKRKMNNLEILGHWTIPTSKCRPRARDPHKRLSVWQVWSCFFCESAWECRLSMSVVPLVELLWSGTIAVSFFANFQM